MMSREGAFSDHSDLPEMIKHLNTAIALDPNFADSYSLLAFAQMSAGDPAKGLVSMQKAASLNPRNERYQLNLAEMYLNNQETDPAIAILDGLARTGSPGVAARAGERLQQALEFKAAIREAQTTNPGVGPENDGPMPADALIRTEKNPEPQEQVGDITSRTPPRYLKGIIVSVDCSSPPAATLTVVSGGRNWKMQVSDSQHVLLIGADSFSCRWSKQKVALNYRETGVGMGRIVSIEVQ